MQADSLNLYQSQKVRWGLFVAFTIAWFYLLSTRILAPTDEGRYAEMAREMLASGDWVTPRLNDIKYFYKPPLQAWMNTISFALFGLGEWQARLWTGLAGFLGILATGYAAHRIFGARQGFYAALILVSSFWWAGLGHINTLDMGLSGMMTISLCAMLVAQRDEATSKERRNFMWLCWAAMALAVLSKGLIGIVLPGAVLVLYTFISRDWRIWGRLYLVSGLVIFFAICTPWFVLVSERNPEFPHFFFIHEHFQRFLTKVHFRLGPWYYFIPLLIIGIVPWLAMLPSSLLAGLRAAPNERQFKPKLLLVIWACFIFFFFSYSSSKLPSYILPIFPALALLLASLLDSASRKQLLVLAGSILLMAFVALIAYSQLDLAKLAPHPLEVPIFTAFAPWTEASIAVAAVGAVIALYFANKTARDYVVVTLAISGFIFGQLMIQASDAGGRYRAGYDLIPTMAAKLKPEMKLYAVGLYEQCIPFYLRRTMILVEHKDELAFGLAQQPELWIPKRSDFLTIWNTGPAAMAILRPAMYEQMQKEGVAMTAIAQDSRRVIVLNRAAQP